MYNSSNHTKRFTKCLFCEKLMLAENAVFCTVCNYVRVRLNTGIHEPTKSPLFLDLKHIVTADLAKFIHAARVEVFLNHPNYFKEVDRTTQHYFSDSHRYAMLKKCEYGLQCLTIHDRYTGQMIGSSVFSIDKNAIPSVGASALSSAEKGNDLEENILHTLLVHRVEAFKAHAEHSDVPLRFYVSSIRKGIGSLLYMLTCFLYRRLDLTAFIFSSLQESEGFYHKVGADYFKGYRFSHQMVVANYNRLPGPKVYCAKTITALARKKFTAILYENIHFFRVIDSTNNVMSIKTPGGTEFALLKATNRIANIQQTLPCYLVLLHDVYFEVNDAKQLHCAVEVEAHEYWVFRMQRRWLHMSLSKPN